MLPLKRLSLFAAITLLSACDTPTPQVCLDAIDCAGFIDENFGSETQAEAESIFLSEDCWGNDQAVDACTLACGQFLDDSQALIEQSDVEDIGICRR